MSGCKWPFKADQNLGCISDFRSLQIAVVGQLRVTGSFSEAFSGKQAVLNFTVAWPESNGR